MSSGTNSFQPTDVYLDIECKKRAKNNVDVAEVFLDTT
jgi:hypothetical protein